MTKEKLEDLLDEMLMHNAMGHEYAGMCAVRHGLPHAVVCSETEIIWETASELAQKHYGKVDEIKKRVVALLKVNS